MKTPVIFLDWEGVMIGQDKQWSVSAMNELNQLCLEVAAAIVLTTSYRYSQPPKTLHQMMRQNGLDASIPVLGETRNLDAYRAAAKMGDLDVLVTFERWSKGQEIENWLEAHPEVERFVVIDDHPEICTPYESRCVVPVGVFNTANRLEALTLLELS